MDLADLSAPAAAVQRATEAGTGVLAVGRPWVQFEGWVLKESGALTGGWHLRYFVVSGDRLEYFKEEKLKLEVKPGESASTLLAALSLELDQTNVVCIANSGAIPPKERQLHEGDVIIGVNGEPCVGRAAGDSLSEALSAGPVTCAVLRPKGRIALHGAAVVPGGPRKGGGHIFTLSVSESSSRRSKYNLVCADERLCAGWIASIKEAIAASAMEEIKTAVRPRGHTCACPRLPSSRHRGCCVCSHTFAPSLGSCRRRFLFARCRRYRGWMLCRSSNLNLPRQQYHRGQLRPHPRRAGSPTIADRPLTAAT